MHHMIEYSSANSSALFKIQFKMREHIRNVKEEGKYFFV